MVAERHGAVGPHRSVTTFHLRLAAIALGALVLRIVYVIVVRDDALGGDGFAYHYAAIALSDGKGFVDTIDPAMRPTAHHPPA